MAKKAAPKAAEPKAAAPSKAASKPATKTEFYSALAEKTGLSKKQVASVFEALVEFHNKELGKKGPGIVQVPGLYKVKVVNKPATPARPGFNPQTKEAITIKAKPARKVVKVTPLKALKDMI
ncbi:DNA-binding protein HRL53 [Aquisphaera giovannonii]|uniref:Viral histone-like protein n=1 Tax=Aquisphaera giovannonii TaxID=406548 RepID=A0A5B9WC97_9BACT|nr:HU family DNA-binding protein [Aquisphaera giovannonii]QEH38147.1 DNA-binding protein HRL53 [Aquisphaera giovannonii]